MKRRIISVLAALPVLLALVVFAPDAGASPSIESWESLVRITQCQKKTTANISSPGNTAWFDVVVEFPARISDGVYPHLNDEQLEDLELSIGSAFGFVSGETKIKPFKDNVPGSGVTTASFEINLVYRGSGNDLILTLSHPTIVSTGPVVIATASSSWSFFITETISPPPPVDVPQPDPPNYGATPQLTLTGGLPSLEAGKRDNIRFTLTNNSQYIAYNVSITVIEGVDKLFRPAAISGSVVSIGTIRTGSSNATSVSIPVEIFDDVKEGYYTIQLRFNMTNYAGSAIEQSSSIQIYVVNPNSSGSAGKPSLSMTSATVDKNTPGSDGLITLAMVFANIGDGVATDAKVRLTGFKNTEITLNESIVTKPLGDIASGGSAAATYSLKVANNLEAGSYQLGVEVLYKLPDGTEASMSDTAYINIIRPSGSQNNVQLTGIVQDVSNPGSSNTIRITLSVVNKGSTVARDVSLGLSNLSSSTFTLADGFGDEQLGDIAPGETVSATVALYVSQGLSNGNYPLTTVIKYTDANNAGALPSSVETVVYVFVGRPDGGASATGNVRLVGISQDVSNPGSSNIIRVTLTVENKGVEIAENVSVGFGGLSSSSFTLSGSFGDRSLGNIAPGATASATIALYVSENLPNGNHQLAVLLRQSDPAFDGAMTDPSETNVYIFVNRPEKNDPDEDIDSSVPRVIISRHSISVETVVAGGPFELSVTLLNTSTNKNVKNMKVTVTDKDGIFIPVEGVNSFYIAELPISQTTEISIVLSPKQDAETKSFPVSISLDYEDEKNISYSVTESLSIPVYQPQRLEMTNVNFYDEGNGMAYLSFQFINKGKSSLYNMNIRIVGPMTAMEGDYYIGMFGPGQSDYFEDTIIPQVFGEIGGDILLEYEDSSGTQQELRYPITAYLNEPFSPDPGFPGEPWPVEPGWPGEIGMGEESGGLNGWLLWTIIGGSALVVVIVTVVIVKKVKHKKIELEDNE